MRSFEERSRIRHLAGIEKFCFEETIAFRFNANERKSYVVIILLRVPGNELHPKLSYWITNSVKNGLFVNAFSKFRGSNVANLNQPSMCQVTRFLDLSSRKWLLSCSSTDLFEKVFSSIGCQNEHQNSSTLRGPYLTKQSHGFKRKTVRISESRGNTVHQKYGFHCTFVFSHHENHI